MTCAAPRFEGEWAYRESGLLGTERNAQGAVPVVLALQQLDANLGMSTGNRPYSVSLDLKPKKGQLERPCEVDFAWIIPGRYSERTVVIIGVALLTYLPLSARHK